MFLQKRLIKKSWFYPGFFIFLTSLLTHCYSSSEGTDMSAHQYESNALAQQTAIYHQGVCSASQADEKQFMEGKFCKLKATSWHCPLNHLSLGFNIGQRAPIGCTETETNYWLCPSSALSPSHLCTNFVSSTPSSACTGEGIFPKAPDDCSNTLYQRQCSLINRGNEECWFCPLHFTLPSINDTCK